MIPNAAFLDAGSTGDADLTPLHRLPMALSLYPSTAPDQVVSRLQQHQIAIVNKVVLDAAIIRQLPQLRYIAVTATGTNNVDLIAASHAGITVQNVSDYATAAVAQHVFALLLHLTNQCAAYQQAVQQGKWSQSPHFCLLEHPIQELAGQTMTIVGYGVLGQATAKLAQAFGMTVCVAERPGATLCRPGRTPFRDALTQADVLSLHCPLTSDNQQLIGAEQLSWLKPSAILINTARGGLVDSTALLKALQQQQLQAAALDVLELEPPPAEHPLLQRPHPRLLLTPHVAWASRAARNRLIATVARQLTHWLQQRSESNGPTTSCTARPK
ncbi:D-2-hydroxyacid dehydrogenase [Alkalimonas delamerensis]|uniref:D-2-hydroxyacid dehydrogenase n=1 Tax=Alkalimonas delamerensis TaxID=265981 RepID=A0ABT9GL12_9GAMM|nr:D-2-hydroxyacid dehydrogenase [Alkalimonas delamerensis]MDP4527652.1 D-2-hydroxyacid dehydrogenase [Alkalimonas delamerensis]